MKRPESSRNTCRTSGTVKAGTPHASTPRLCEVMRLSAHHVQAVLAGRSLSDSLAQTFPNAPTKLPPVPTGPSARPALKAAAQAVSFHVMRRLGLARALGRLLLKHPPASPLLEALLLVALTLLETALRAASPQDNPFACNEPTNEPVNEPVNEPANEPVYAVHTVVDQAVRAAAALQPSYKALFNACLRRLTREYGVLVAQAIKNEEARWNFPAWWVQALRRAYPAQWQALLAQSNRPGPLTLRVNRRQTSVAALCAALTQAGMAYQCVKQSKKQCLESGHENAGQEKMRQETQDIVLVQPRAVQQIPGFEEGWWSVQDASAQLAAHWLAPQDGERVLDACAAPGGKATHLLELADIDLLALDADAQRLARVQQNLERLRLHQMNVTLRCADAASLPDWWDGQPFDAVLADVPCTASGVVRRHPDIRWLRQAGDVARTAAQQQRLADALWQTVRPGGRMLYAVCSIFPQEGEMQAQRFVRHHADARRMPASGQILPLPDAVGQQPCGDGFFYALFVKAATVKAAP